MSVFYDSRSLDKNQYYELSYKINKSSLKPTIINSHCEGGDVKPTLQREAAEKEKLNANYS
ncbi:MAG: hypothetical protein V1712_02870 [Patescibacteria group bacterium]